MFRLDAVCFTEPFQFDRVMMRDFAEAPGAIALLVTDDADTELLGFVLLHLEGLGDGLYGYVVTIDVSPEHRRQGIAAAMLTHAEIAAHAAGAQQIGLHVAADNRGAIAFYLHQNYQRVGRAKHFYREAYQDALVFAKPL
jgi:ribosomal-protein-alanine N-acetyltransferase